MSKHSTRPSPWQRLTSTIAGTALVLTSASALIAGPIGATPAAAATGDVTLAGDLQSELGCPSDWQPDCATTALTDADGDGVYTFSARVPSGTWEFKVALDGTWDEAYGVDGNNAKIHLAAPADLTFSFDSATKKLGLSSTSIKGAYDDEDAALMSAPVREGTDEVFYFVLTDRFANGDASNDEGGLTGDRLVTGFDPTDKGFYHGGDIQGIIDQLDYIQGMGATAIWLTPSFTNRPVQGEGENASAGYHGYWVTDFTQIDPHLGGNDALAALRDAAHARGMKLYLDIITNHTADLIDYAEGIYSYVDISTAPYRDADGNVVDVQALANQAGFPQIASSAYTPVRAEGNTVVPEVLNDVSLYHNRGNSTWTGESVTFGDFDGLDDLMTENPLVEQTFEEVYTAWMDFGVDGFRIDTVKHVNREFWTQWTAAIQEHADATNPDFFTFGEVYDADAAKLSPYLRDTDMGATLDFTFQAAALNYAKGYTAKGLSSLYAADDMYTTAHSSAAGMPTFLGNHDMGRIGYLLANGAGSPETLQRDQLAHSLMFLSRGQPVVYYGDEQGFAGLAPGNDKNARQDMFATQVAEVASQQLVDGTAFGSGEHFDTTAPLYTQISALSRLRADNAALSSGAQIELHADEGTGVYAFARVDRSEKVEHLVALNNAAEPRTVTFTSLTPGATYAPLYTATDPVSADATGSVTLTVPAMAAVVFKADRQVASVDGIDEDEAAVRLMVADGAGRTGTMAEITARTAPNRWAETSFAYRPLGTTEWTPLGTAEDSTPRVFADLSALPEGTAVEVRAVSTDAAGRRSADSALVIAGNDLSTEANGDTPPTGELVTVPGSHNSAMGCTGDWKPDCAAAALTRDEESGIWSGTFDLPAGTWEYKVAVGGSWDENYGAGGVPGGANISYTTTSAGAVTFFYDPVTHRVWNTTDGPVITLPGSHQAALGCTRGANGGNWVPDCLVPLMYPMGDGTWSFSTDRLPAGTYEVKVAHNRSWDENYGVGGAPGGANYSYSTAAHRTVTFTYTMSTHILDIQVADPPLAGLGQQRAYWVDESTLAWPTSLLPSGVTPEQVVAGDTDLAFSLVTAPTGGAALVDGAVTGATTHTLSVLGNLPAAVTQARPNLSGYIALGLGDALNAAGVREALTGQVAVLETSGGTAKAFTGVQLAPVLDALYAQEAREADLGVTWTGGRPSFALWAPTAKKVTLVSWNTGLATGSVAEVAGEGARTAAVRGEDGRWTVANEDGAITAGAQYTWEVEVYVPSTGKVETNTVTDPYSVALTVDSTRSVAIDLANEDLAPAQWLTTPAPAVRNDASRTIYELHVRDFSAADESVPEALRGTYKAFTLADSAGMTHLAELAEAGMDTVHLLPTFDIATIPERRADQKVPQIPADAGPASSEQQAAVTAVADEDAFNWGYDPLHWMAPEGSYATEGNQDGGARVVEFREMVGALHATGLQVVLDEVYNHTAASGQDPKSVLDRVVPGYYQRLDANGAVETSTCCSNVATENAMSEQLMIDSLVTWARDYHVDGFRFDLMGHHSRQTMERAKAALAELTLEKDGVDGSSIYLYGEGWNFGEVANNALFTQATQGQLNGTGIGSFNDRLRDAVHGGGPFDPDHRTYQGFGTGQYTDPNGLDPTSPEEQRASLAHNTDLVRIGLVGNLADYSLTSADGTVKKGSELLYNGSPAGYASQPTESVNYVDAHDNETLFDLLTYKLPVSMSMEDRIRMNTLSLATVALGQSPSFWASGTELLRSKSLDRDSYNSGDHFNAIDWTGQTNGFANGLPVASKNGEKWPIMTPLLENPALKPTADDIQAAESQALDLLRLRTSTPLFTLGSAAAISQKVTFPASGPGATPGSLLMLIEDPAGAKAVPGTVVVPGSPDAVASRLAGELARAAAGVSPRSGGAPAVVTASDLARATADVDPALDAVLTVFNASDEPLTQVVEGQAGKEFALSAVQMAGDDPVVKQTTWDSATGTVTVPARTVAVLELRASTPALAATHEVTYAPVEAEAGSTLDVLPVVTDSSGTVVAPPSRTDFSLGEGAPEGARIDATTGRITWDVPAGHASASMRVLVVVTYSDGSVDQAELVVTVKAASTGPSDPTDPASPSTPGGSSQGTSPGKGILAVTGVGGLALVLAAALVAGGMGLALRRRRLQQ